MLARLVEVVGYVITVGGLLLGAVNVNFALAVRARGVGLRHVAVALGRGARGGEFPAVSPARDLGRLLLFATPRTSATAADGVVAPQGVLVGVPAEQVWERMTRKALSRQGNRLQSRQRLDAQSAAVNGTQK